jgi:hypothetical protein
MRKKIMIVLMISLTFFVCWYGFIAHAQQAQQSQTNPFSNIPTIQTPDNSYIAIDQVGNSIYQVTQKTCQDYYNELNADTTESQTLQSIVNNDTNNLGIYQNKIQEDNSKISTAGC